MDDRQTLTGRPGAACLRALAVCWAVSALVWPAAAEDRKPGRYVQLRYSALSGQIQNQGNRSTVSLAAKYG